ncbi:flagellar biosynthesis protein FlhF-like protein [Ponticaulis sp.]|uniref:flagellar biosynthesis protein FlhF n=1 Tax=Ponticaulis sp. TaxID=2020902 RepID=UPI000B68A0BA|nr:flagellar biosynthesis protein FlhF-like protein [Ponticaulis sp.]MAI89798.1 flagellar biosynthesis protein FlhF-like protein [Ponticaulis sp.]OUX99475.1 MAG: hypothetical protein CBB65_05105 [Hyphomonadaceae bacterium TMED5]|tara:strand:+ start:33344 stop:34339 length:996 start_codon:yes stop_codon:yes gene_type:complete
MKMKLYSAATRDEAIALAYADMGQDAIILSEWEAESGFEIRAGVERATQRATPQFELKAAPRPSPILQINRYRDQLKEILAWHGAPDGFSDVVATSGARLVGASKDPSSGFSTALEGLIGFSPIAPALDRPVMLVGPPGSGKTSVAAKLVRRAAAANVDAMPVVADFDATNGHTQLAAYLRRDVEEIESCLTPDDLMFSLNRIESQSLPHVIDTPPINPTDREDMDRLRDLINLVDAEPVLVISAEGHPMDLEDNVKAFAELGIRRCIITKLDVVRRRGGVLFAIANAKLNLSHLALTPFIGGGLIPATSNRLARILLEDAPGAEILKGAA